MNYKASFNNHGEIIWEELQQKSPGLSQFQGAMFLDRPDLWPCKPKGRRPGAKPLPGQIAFAFVTDYLHECSGPNCPIKKGKGDTLNKKS